MMRCVDYRPYQKGFLMGFATLELASGLILTDFTHHQSGGREWIGVPGRPVLDNAGNVARTDRGKPQYVQSIGFTTPAVRDAFLSQAMRAIHEFLAQKAKTLQTEREEGR